MDQDRHHPDPADTHPDALKAAEDLTEFGGPGTAADTLPDVRGYLRDRALGLKHPDAALGALAPGLVEARQEAGHAAGVRRFRVAALLDQAIADAESCNAAGIIARTDAVADLAEAWRRLAAEQALEAPTVPTLADLLTDEVIRQAGGHVYAELDRAGHSSEAAIKAQSATVGALRILRDEATHG